MKDFGPKRLSQILYYCVDAQKTRRQKNSVFKFGNNNYYFSETLIAVQYNDMNSALQQW